MPIENKPSRIVIIDSLRGFALAGVAIVHIIEQYLAGPPPQNFMEGINTTPDLVVSGIVQFLIIGKFFALFSILFGLSFFIQMDSADKKGNDFSGRFLWRALLLFIIGYVHQLFYRGDILTIYALAVPFLIPFYKISNKWILGVAALFFLSLPRFMAFAIWSNESLFGFPGFLDMEDPLKTAYFEVIASGSLTEVFQQNAIYGMKTKMDFQWGFFGRFYYTIGYFLLGLWLGKIGLFHQLETYLPKVKKNFKWLFLALVIAFLLTGAAFGTAPQPVDFSSWQHVIGINCADWINLSMALIILSAFLLLYKKDFWHNKLSYFAPYGRMALTNYVLQSIIGTFLLFGWGLGWFGQIRTMYLFLIALLLIAVQVSFSKYWLQHFKYGPLEWLWRCGTYLKLQAFRKG